MRMTEDLRMADWPGPALDGGIGFGSVSSFLLQIGSGRWREVSISCHQCKLEMIIPKRSPFLSPMFVSEKQGRLGL